MPPPAASVTCARHAMPEVESTLSGAKFGPRADGVGTIRGQPVGSMDSNRIGHLLEIQDRRLVNLWQVEESCFTSRLCRWTLAAGALPKRVQVLCGSGTTRAEHSGGAVGIRSCKSNRCGGSAWPQVG